MIYGQLTYFLFNYVIQNSLHPTSTLLSRRIRSTECEVVIKQLDWVKRVGVGFLTLRCLVSYYSQELPVGSVPGRVFPQLLRSLFHPLFVGDLLYKFLYRSGTGTVRHDCCRRPPSPCPSSSSPPVSVCPKFRSVRDSASFQSTEGLPVLRSFHSPTPDPKLGSFTPRSQVR